MKKFLRGLGALALTIMCAMTFTACGDDGDEEPQGANAVEGQAQQITFANFVGTWEITWSKGYTTKNGVKVDEWNKSVADEHNRLVIDDSRNVKFMEYSTSKGTWHEDGRGALSLINGVWQCVGEINGKIVSVDGDKMVVEYYFEEDKGAYEYIDYYTDTCYRVK